MRKSIFWMGLVLLITAGGALFADERAAQTAASSSGSKAQTQGRLTTVPGADLGSACKGAPPCGVKDFHQSDCAFEPFEFKPAYPACGGARILFDVSNRNFHTITARSEDPDQKGRYWAFAKLLIADGYVLEESTRALSGLLPATEARLLVIADALPVGDEEQALSGRETDAIIDWISKGGSLLLIFDHPDYNRVDGLIARFGLSMGVDSWRIHEFNRVDGTLNSKAAVSNGRYQAELVDGIRMNRGSTFQQVSAPPDMAEVEWVLKHGPRNLARPGQSIGDHLSGVMVEYGKGRVYVSGEAAMLTSVKSGAGFSSSTVNQQFVLNIIHWLDRLYD